ncbi:MAG: twin-arginine translocase subunit TatC [Rickettsiales bacterium]|nr:MAG: twin-arginine translocase subunit TatC [Rickettsiales bacterium]
MKKFSFKEHFFELKKRFIKIFISFILCFLICYYYSDYIYKIILAPLSEVIEGRDKKIIYTGLTEAFFAYIKLSIFAAILSIFPVCCYQIYAFISPGLYLPEKKLVCFTLCAAPVLFYFGCFFMYYLIIPNAWLFFTSFEKANLGIPLVLEARISEYLNLVIQLTLAFGMAFQLPIIMIILSTFGLIKAEILKKRRRIAIVIIFIAAAVFTPPDVFSQIALALPLLLLYEISILICKFLEKRDLKNVGH